MKFFSDSPPPGLESRFCQPPGWRWHSFVSPRGKRLRFGCVIPDKPPEAVIVCLQGLSEFTEKYFELANDLLGRNYGFWMFDWEGQGRSERYNPKQPHKRHSGSFEHDVADLHYLILEYVKHSSVHPDVGRIPLVMLGHSTGANIGLRYLAKHPDMFACAAFTAPLMGLHALKALPRDFSLILTGLFSEFMGQSYVFGGGPWKNERQAHEMGLLSSDPVRSEIHDTWFRHDPQLQVGSPTFAWLHEANASCNALWKGRTMQDIKTPCLFALAGKDKLVDNTAARTLIARMPNAKILELEESLHEVLMERDSIRDAFLTAFLELLQVNRVKEKLKPF